MGRVTMAIGLIASRVRVEEKLLLEAYARRGVARNNMSNIGHSMS